MRATAQAQYRFAAHYALTRSIIIADTKFEFGTDDAGHLTSIDEALTPDSSRFWPADTYQPGTSPPSFDKQFVRDYPGNIGVGQARPDRSCRPRWPGRPAKYAEALRV